MKKLYALFFAFVLIAKCSYAQITFEKTYGGANVDFANHITEASEGGYLLTGYTKSFGVGDFDLYLIKTDASGNVCWKKSLGYTNYDYGSAAVQTPDCDFLVTGISAGDLDVNLVFLKTDVNGTTTTYKTFGGGGSYTQAFDVLQTSNGDFVFSGTSNGLTGAQSVEHFFVLRTTAAGDTVWTVEIDNTVNGNITWQETAFGISETSDGGFIVTGSNGNYATGMNDVMLVRLTSGGVVLWAKTYGGVADDAGRYTYQTPDGGFIIGGGTRSYGAGSGDFYLIKTDSVGTLEWSKTYGGAGDDALLGFTKTNDGGFIMCGNSDNTAYAVKVNSTGDTLWTKNYGGGYTSKFAAVKQTTDGGYAFTGGVYGGQGQYDVYLVKTDANGNSGCDSAASTATVVGTPSTVEGARTIEIKKGGVPVTMADVTVNAGGITVVRCGTSGNPQCGTGQCPTGIANAEDEAMLKIFPNPSSGLFQLVAEQPVSKIEVVNLLGQQVFVQQNIGQKNISVNISAEAKGIYTVNIWSGEKVLRNKIVLE